MRLFGKSIASLLALCASLMISGCGADGSTNPSGGLAPEVDIANGTYTVGGTISGLNGTVILQNAGGNNLTVSGNGTFTFDQGAATGATYHVTVSKQPNSQTCSVSSGAGTVATNNITNVVVVCASNANSYSLGGTITGLSGTVVLQNNSGDDLSISNNGTFTFSTVVASKSPYTVTVLAQPQGQTCSVANGGGTMAFASVTNVAVTCSANLYTVGGTISGLVGTVELLNNGGNSYSRSSTGSFTLPQAIASGNAYNVTIGTQPTGQTCTVGSGSGTIAAGNITNITVACNSQTYKIGGAVAGLNGTVVLQNNSGNNLSISANGAFQFSSAVAYANPYNVTVLTQPTGQTCSVSGGSGTVNLANITNVGVTCSVNSYTVGGSRSGISWGSVVLQNNGGDDLTTTSNGAFQFAAAIPYGSNYGVTVLSAPANLTCPITNGSGTITGNVANVSLTCSCAGGYSACSGDCVDTQTNTSHCGGCGNVCAGGQTCVSGSCQAPPTCFDSVKNGSETDVDCGGSCANKCATGKVCAISSDCVSIVCSGGVCQAPTCFDNVKNGMETDVDCGGASCSKCAAGKQCSVASDCLSGTCNAGLCQ